MKLTIEQISAATGGAIIARGAGVCEGVSTDSRTIEPNMFFVPIVGERFDGHEFIRAALERDAAGFVFSPERVSVKEAAKFTEAHASAAVATPDTLKALGDMARFARDSIKDLRVVAITGSNGKSTTKEMTAAILSESMRVARNEGNLNNLIGLPLTLLALSGELDAAVLEMGTNSRGEIARLAEIARPNVGCVTNVGPVHLEGLGSVEGVAREKGALARAIEPGGVFAQNCDDEFTSAMAGETRAELICYGMKDRPKTDCREFITARDIKIEEEEIEMLLVVGADEARIKIAAPGKHNAINALAAAALARAMGSALDEIKSGLQKWRPLKMRGEVLKTKGGITILVDCYNSNPAGLNAALSVLAGYTGRRIAIVGDMLELGDYAEQAHRNAGTAVAEAGVEVLIAVGEWAEMFKKGFVEKMPENAQVAVAKDASEAAEITMEKLKKGDVVLVKASRLLHLEEVVEAIENELGSNTTEEGA